MHQFVQRQFRNWQIRRSCGPASRKRWLRVLKAVDERLHWHCHFKQKQEDQPDIQDVNMHRACDGLRQDNVTPEIFEAWKGGRTGYPLVDA